MKWYSGGITDAINASLAKNAIFVVYIEGTDDQSKKMTDLIDNGILGESLQKDYFVAIKIEANSVPHQQFSEVFKEPSVPSVYFIGKKGFILDIITSVDNLDILKRIETILSKAGISSVSASSSSSETLIQKEQASASGDNICQNGVCQLPRDLPTNSNSEAPQEGQKTEENVKQDEMSAEEKIQRAQELIEQKRQQKEAEEKQNEIRKEIERRKMGQSVQQLKKWQEDQELKQAMEEREKEKRENQLARERVLAQIAQDKAERQARLQPQTSTAESPRPSTSPKINSNTTRLQFRLPDGSSNLHEFANADTLQNVVTYIKDNLLINNFKLSTTFPRREFTTNDYSQSLLDLELCPNAVILVLPINNGAVSINPGGTFTSLIWTLFAPILSLYGYLKSFIFGRNENSNRNKRPSEPDDTGSQNPKKRIVRDSTVVKRQGNVHRLTDRKDSDDEGNTWNGNSTQQM